MCAELSTRLRCISMNPGISFVFRLMSSYFWAPVIIRMTNLMTTMINVHSPHRVCDGDLLRMLQFNVTNNIKIRILKSLLLWFYFTNQKWYYFLLLWVHTALASPSHLRASTMSPSIGWWWCQLCTVTLLDCKHLEHWRKSYLSRSFLSLTEHVVPS